MAVLDLQRRGQQIGRLRMGVQVATSSGKMRPDRLDTWRFTTQSKPAADAIAFHFGGEVREWAGEWEVITRESSISVMVPPRDQVVSQFYELWSKGGAQRRCDSQTELISGKPCLCPHAADPGDPDEVARCAVERSILASQNPPKACKLVTRISVMIPDLPGLGVWRLDTGSYYAGVEIGDTAALMELAREKNVFLAANLRIEQRSRVAGGQTKKYPVPVLEVLATFRQIASGELEAGGITAQLPPAPGERPKAITAAPDVPRPGQAMAATAAPGPGDLPDEELPEYLPGSSPGSAPLSDEERYNLAQAIADECATEDVAAGRFTALWALAREQGAVEEHVCTDRVSDTWEPLGEYLRDLWRERAKEAP